MPGNTLILHPNHRLREIEARYRDCALMQKAGAAAANTIRELRLDRDRPILILVGPGNNGGDAFEAARLLRHACIEVCVVFAADPAQLPGDAAAAWQSFVEAGGRTSPDIPPETRWGMIVDGLFGIGLKRAPEGIYARWIETANRLAERDRCPLLALDCPSGLDTDTGQVPGTAIRATHTLTFIALKPGLLTADGPDLCGRMLLADLDLPPAEKTPADGYQLSLADFADCLKPRRLNTHKGSFGSAGLLGGAEGMLGAMLLAGRAALRIGAGRVYVGLLDPGAPTVDPLQPELMLRKAERLLDAGELQALACGPGLGQSATAEALLGKLIEQPQAIVLDADALNLLAGETALAEALRQRNVPAILTPHPAEAARLLACSTADIQANRIEAARELARHYASHVALKGCGTVLATADGRWWINTTGNPGMATAGMGDVLSGLIVGLLAQGWSPEAAMLGGVHLHGAAADHLVSQGCGPIGLVAGEVVDAARRLFNGWIAQRTG